MNDKRMNCGDVIGLVNNGGRCGLTFFKMEGKLRGVSRSKRSDPTRGEKKSAKQTPSWL